MNLFFKGETWFNLLKVRSNDAKIIKMLKMMPYAACFVGER